MLRSAVIHVLESFSTCAAPPKAWPRENDVRSSAKPRLSESALNRGFHAPTNGTGTSAARLPDPKLPPVAERYLARSAAALWTTWTTPTNDVAPAQRRDRGIERAAPRDAVDDEQERVEFAESPELGHRARWTIVASGRDRNAGRQRQRVLQ